MLMGRKLDNLQHSEGRKGSDTTKAMYLQACLFSPHTHTQGVSFGPLNQLPRSDYVYS